MREYRQKNKGKIKLRDRIRKKLSRAKDRVKRKKEKDAEIEKQIKQGDLNAGLNDGFMSWEEYQKFYADMGYKVNKKMYFEDRHRHNAEQESKRHSPETTGLRAILGNVPYNAEYPAKCENVRLMLLGLRPKETWVIDSHNTCDFCNEWIRRNKRHFSVNWSDGAVDLFHGHENQPRHGVPNKESEKIMSEEMKKMYGDNYNEEWTE